MTGDVQRGRWRVMGLVKTTIMVAACVVANNLRIARAWAAKYDKIQCDPDMLSLDPQYIPLIGVPEGYRGLAPPLAA